MASIGKKILSAFVEVTDKEKPVTKPPDTTSYSSTPPAGSSYGPPADTSGKFKQYFDKLFSDANIPGPDYFEFSKMIAAMSSIPDEKARYSAAFAGLQVQGLDKQKLLGTAAEYLRVLDTDAGNFNATVDAALQEKVYAKRKAVEEKAALIQQLTEQITDLHNQMALLQNEVKENEEKIESSTGGYKAALENMKHTIQRDMEKIKQYIN